MTLRLIQLSYMVLLSSAAFASETLEHEAPSLFSMDMLYKGINFLALLLLLHFFAKKPLAKMLGDTARSKRDAFFEQQRLVEEAETRLTQIKQQMAAQEAALKKHQQQALAAIQLEQKRIIAAAKQQAEKIEQSTQRRMDQNLVKANNELRAYLAQEATLLAEGLIKNKLDVNEQTALFNNYANGLGQLV